MKELLLYMAKNLVDNPDAVTVNEITDEMFDDLEEILVMGDVGVTTATEIIDRLRAKVAKENLRNGKQVRNAIKEMAAKLYPNDIDKYIEYKSPCIQELYVQCGLTTR